MDRQSALKSYLKHNWTTSSIIGGGMLRKKGSAMMSWKQRGYFVKDDHTLLYFDQVSNAPKGYVNISEVSLSAGPSKNISKSGCRSEKAVSILMTLVRESKVMPIVFDDLDQAKKFCVLVGFSCSTNIINFSSEMMWSDVTTLLRERLRLVGEEKVGYFQSNANTVEEMEEEMDVLQEEYEVLQERLAAIDTDLSLTNYDCSEAIDALEEPYMSVRSKLIRPHVQSKAKFFEFKINANKRFISLALNQKHSGDFDISVNSSQENTPQTQRTPSVATPAALPRQYKSLKSNAKVQQWRDKVLPFAEECLQAMRSILPKNIAQATDAQSLMRTQRSLSMELATRFVTKKCLWILRLDRSDIQTIDDDLLMGIYNTKGQNLDLIETAAVYAMIPEEFFSVMSSSASRLEWSSRVQRKLRHMLRERDEGTLPHYRSRCPAYLVPPPAVHSAHSSTDTDGAGGDMEWGGDEEEEDEEEETGGGGRREETSSPDEQAGKLLITTIVPFSIKATTIVPFTDESMSEAAVKTSTPPALLSRSSSAPPPKREEDPARDQSKSKMNSTSSASKLFNTPQTASAEAKRVRKRSLFGRSGKAQTLRAKMSSDIHQSVVSSDKKAPPVAQKRKKQQEI